MKKGLFITFEGPDGSGKTTQIMGVKEILEEKGMDATITREPGGTVISEKIRELILDRSHQEMSPVAEALLYAAARAQHVDEVIRPALEAGKMIICDRFVDSSIAYQGFGRGLGEAVETINDFAVGGVVPDLTFLLLVNPERARQRLSRTLDRLEAEKLEYHQTVYDGYLKLAARYPQRIITMDGSRQIKDIRKEIKGHIDRLIEERYGQ